ncbi:MAG: hypothetical protein M3O87_00155 [Candidatus Dormibacteraeota bacterium]|nr:hypothetical protein [Candidatus Dormibacteraeota bacterium]
MADDVVTAYLLDRAGPDANAFGAKLTGRPGIEIVGGADDVDDALTDLSMLGPDVVLVSTDFGGAGCVVAVESVMSLRPDSTVVMLSTRGDKALVQAGMRAGAAGSLDRNASPGETITALHVHKRRRLGENIDLSMAEPSADEPMLRVSGALPVFPGASARGDEPGVEVAAITDPLWSGDPRLGTERPPLDSGWSVPDAPDGKPVVPSFDQAVAPERDHMESLRARLDSQPPAAAAKKKKKKGGFRLFGRRKQKKSKDWGPATPTVHKESS